MTLLLTHRYWTGPASFEEGGTKLLQTLIPLLAFPTFPCSRTIRKIQMLPLSRGPNLLNKAPSRSTISLWEGLCIFPLPPLPPSLGSASVPRRRYGRHQEYLASPKQHSHLRLRLQLWSSVPWPRLPAIFVSASDYQRWAILAIFTSLSTIPALGTRITVLLRSVLHSNS
jgi:hypothetical protein